MYVLMDIKVIKFSRVQRKSYTWHNGEEMIKKHFAIVYRQSKNTTYLSFY